MTPDLIAILIFLITITVIAALSKAALSPPKNYRYKVQPYLLTKAELNFYLNLRQRLPRDYGISCKVRLADALKPAERGRKYKAALARIWAKHLDFIIYEMRTGKILSAIELDDRTHMKAQRASRDKFVNAAAEKAGLILHRVRNKAAWSNADISPLLPQNTALRTAPSATSDQA